MDENFNKMIIVKKKKLSKLQNHLMSIEKFSPSPQK